MNDDNSLEEEHPDRVNLLEPLPLVRIICLAYILEHPNSTGYDIMKYYDNHSNGLVDIKSGTIYPELRLLEKQKQLSSEVKKRRGRKSRVYIITGAGKDFLQNQVEIIRLKQKYILNPLVSNN